MRVLIVDDEAVARRRLADIVQGIEGVEVAGQAANTREALELVGSLQPDVLLLDISMPGEDGMSFALRHKDLPPIIFTTASEGDAITAFEASAVDYLLKPVRRHRLERALDKVRQRQTLPSSEASASDSPAAVRISARHGDTTFLFDAREIERFFSADKYTCFMHEGREFLLEMSLNELDRRLAEHDFLRVHRSELVRLSYVRALRESERVIELSSGETARVSRRALPALRRALGLR